MTFPDRVSPTSIEIHETFNPGALTKVSVFNPIGAEVVVWSGVDPTPVTAGRGISRIPVDVPFRTDKVKIYLDSPRVPGWNEIDAVGMNYVFFWWEVTQWAKAASASSSYAK